MSLHLFRHLRDAKRRGDKDLLWKLLSCLYNIHKPIESAAAEYIAEASDAFLAIAADFRGDVILEAKRVIQMSFWLERPYFTSRHPEAIDLVS